MKRISTALALLSLSLLLSACSRQAVVSVSGDVGPSSSSSQPAPTATPTPTPEPLDYVTGFDPLTGEQGDPNDRSRPIAVMIQNNKAGYPQWGLKGAEVLVEAITEGKTTSMMAMYSGNEGLPEKVGAVGPARDLFWQIAMPCDSILMQIGGNIYASNLLNTYQYQNLDGYYVGVASYDLDYEKDKVANHEYCWYTTQSLMETGLSHYGLSKDGDRLSLFNYVRPGQETAPASQAGAEGATSAAASGEAVSGAQTGTPAPAQPMEAARIEITFAEGNTIPLLYNGDTNRWEKYDIDWQPQIDGNYPDEMDPMEKILSYDNVLVLYCSAGVKDDGYTRDYDLSAGTGLYLNGPSCKLIRWKKDGVTGGFTIYDENGQEYPIQPGKCYIAIYGGFAGQAIKVQNSSSQDLTLWDNPAPMEQAQPQEG